MENQSDILGQPELHSKTTSERKNRGGNKKNQVLLSDSLITNQRSHRAKLATLLRFSCFHRDSESMVSFPYTSVFLQFSDPSGWRTLI